MIAIDCLSPSLPQLRFKEDFVVDTLRVILPLLLTPPPPLLIRVGGGAEGGGGGGGGGGQLVDALGAGVADDARRHGHDRKVYIRLVRIGAVQSTISYAADCR